MPQTLKLLENQRVEKCGLVLCNEEGTSTCGETASYSLLSQPQIPRDRGLLRTPLPIPHLPPPTPLQWGERSLTCPLPLHHALFPGRGAGIAVGAVPW